MRTKKGLLILLITILAFVLRAWDFGNNPAGVYVDEASLGYNAYSLLKTGMDEYGKAWPIFLRSFGTYQSALYSYLSIPLVKLIGLSSVGIRTLSLISGLVLVITVCLWMGMTEGLIVAISPVFVFFSRGAFESNLALTIFISGLLLSIKAEKKSNLLLTGLTLLSISAYAYHAQRFLSLVFIVFFCLTYFWRFRENRRKILSYFILAVVIQLPLFWVSLKTGTNTRLLGLMYDDKEGILGFVKHYLVYLFPNNLFSRPDPDLQRSFPDLSVFYWWMFLLFVVGVVKIYKNRHNLKWQDKVMLVLLFVAILPGAITKEYFSTLRVLPMFIPLAWIIAEGWKKLFGKKLKWSLVLVLTACVQLYSSLVLLKNERSKTWGYYYQDLVEKISLIEDVPVIIDNTRLKPSYILFAFYNQYEPEFIQQWHGFNNLYDYYDSYVYDDNQKLKNMEFRPVYWDDDIYIEQYLVGDDISISSEQIEEHKLQVIDTIKDFSGEEVLKILKTNPEAKCLPSAGKPKNKHCL